MSRFQFWKSSRKSARRHIRQAATRPRFEALESKRLLAAHLDDGVLRIEGTSRNDVVAVGAGTYVHVTINGRESIFRSSDVESIDVRCGGGNDRVAISQNILVRSRVDGGKGSDTVNGGGGDDTLVGHGGDDTLRGRDGRDRIYGHSGDDLIEGGDDDDRIDAGEGDDSVDGEGGDDSVHGGTGRDRCSGGSGDDDVFGDDDDDSLRGNSGEDNVHGNRGRDHIYGGTGDDFCDGGEDDDTMRGDDGHDVYDDHGDDEDGDDNVEDDVDDDHGEGGFFVDGDNVELEMSVRADALFAKIKFEQEAEDGGPERKFRVEVFGAAAGAVLDVVVDGLAVGQVTADATGRGLLLLKDGDGGLPFPGDFPTIASGVVISVGPASGAVPAQNVVGDDSDDGGDDD
jgi:Ca2+-binding RTX toxin-like protein